MNIIRIILFSLFIALMVDSNAQGDELDPKLPPRLNFEVLLQKNSLHPNDAVPVEIWIKNCSSQPVEDTRLFFILPTSLTITSKAKNCTSDTMSVPVSNPLTIGKIPPQSINHQTFYFKVGSSIIQGNVRLSFALEYRWKTGKGAFGTSYILQKELVEFSLFGTGRVAGVPLSLFFYLVPGVLLLILLRFLNIPRLEKLSTIEINTLIVLFSICMLTIFSANYGQSISTQRLIWVISLSSLISIAFTLPLIFHKTLKKWRQSYLSSLLIRPTDSLNHALLKAFKAKRNQNKGRVRVKLKDGKVLVGSMYADTVDGVALFGWFLLKPSVMVEKIDDLKKKNDFVKILKIVMDNSEKIQIESTDTIREEINGDSNGTGDELKRIKREEIVLPPHKCEQYQRKPLIFDD